jgi:hypothetical protein
MDYQSYINSSQWSNLRLIRIEFDNHKCRTCGNSDDLEAHHVYKGPPNFPYPANLGEETLADIITLCKFCHEAITDSVRRRRDKYYPQLIAVEESNLRCRIMADPQQPPESVVDDEKNIQNQRNPAVVNTQRPTFRSH